MNRRYVNLILILVLLAVVIWIDLPTNPGIHIGNFDKQISTVLGLDLRGGMQVILKADLPDEATITTQAMQDARQILENRSNGLGVSEVQFQVAGDRNIVGEFPGASNAEDVIASIKETGQLEFVDTGTTFLPAGTEIQTDIGLTEKVTTVPTPTEDQIKDTVWHTVMTGTDLKSVAVQRDPNTGEYVVAFELMPEGSKIFADHTSNNTGKYLSLVLDKKVVSTPRINTAITDGVGEITGGFTVDSANELAVQLRYGSLPIPLKVEQIRVIGPTLGQDSLNKSLVAGGIGFIIVFLFMAIFYKLPGVIADLAIIIYALVTYALFRFIPVTLTLPGIAGFLLSTGSALDANILIFERLKEELRNGRTLQQAIDLGWKRAWPSIRDSNLATLITSAILFWFGSTFGASFVKGFALTLSLGVGVSLLSAIVVTRTFLGIALDIIKHPEDHLNWFGI